MADTHEAARRLPGSPEVLVVGGGLAGAAAAITLAQAGRAVTLLERTRTAHHKVCGEFLSAEALHYLRELGMDPWTLGAKRVTTLRMLHRSRATEQALPFAAASLSRYVLDEAMLSRAVQAGATVVRGASVEALLPSQGSWTATTANAEYSAPVAVLATGKHDLRGHRRTHPAGRSVARHDGLLAFNQYFCLQPSQAEQLRHAIEVVLFPGGYCGLQLVDDGSANLGLLLQQSRFKNLGGWPGVLDHLYRASPHLASRLNGAAPLLAKPLALAHIPYGYSRTTTCAGLYTVGDQAAVIPSFSGDGMSIALHSGVLAARAILQGEPAESFQRRLAHQLRIPLMLGTLVSRALVHAPGIAAAAPPALLRQVALRTRVPAAVLQTRYTS